MSGQKIPDFSNFLEKYAAIEDHLNKFLTEVAPSPTVPETQIIEPDQHEDQQCPGCKSILKTGDVFCSKCGYKIETVAVEQITNIEEPKELKCNSCDTPYAEGDKFCMNCGTKL